MYVRTMFGYTANMEGYAKWVRIYSEIGAAENLMEGWGNDG